MSWFDGPDEEISPLYEALIFDCDGTLVDTMPAHYGAWVAALKPHGLVFPEARFYEMAGVSSIAIVTTLAKEQGIAVDPIAVAKEKDATYLALADHGRAIETVVAIAKRERGRRKLAVASGNVTALVREVLREAGIADLFSVVVGADRVTHGKPAPDLFLLAADELGVAPERCVVYEDGDPGLDAADAAGMFAIDVRPWLGSADGGRLAIDTSRPRHASVTERK